MAIYWISNDGTEQETMVPESQDSFFAICPASRIHEFQERFSFERSTVEEVQNAEDRIRFTGYEGYDFVSMVYMEPGQNGRAERSGRAGSPRMGCAEGLISSEINLFLAREYVIWAIPDETTPALRRVVERVKNQLRQAPASHARAVLTLLNEIVSDVSDMLEASEDALEAIHERIVRGEMGSSFYEIHAARKQAYHVKKYLRLTANIGSQLLLDENQWIPKKHYRMFRNIDSRFKRLHSLSESLYDLSREVLNAYDSKITAKTNDVVNKLTILTIFFGPLTVITGIYGMNFRYMPELEWRFGYPLALGLMVGISVILYIVLKRKRWL